MTSPMIVVPLYIYPAEDAWQPLVEAAARHPKAKFMVIVNPNSGPGESTLPDANYVAALRRLSVLPNVELLGYVHCSYGQREITTITTEIDKYSHWSAEFTKLGGEEAPVSLHGIFFDEVPSNVLHLDFMSRLSSHARAQWAKDDRASQPAIVIYNPGVLVGREFYEHSDYVVAFEHADSTWRDFENALAGLSRSTRAKTVVLIHTFHRDGEHLASLVSEIRRSGLGGQFVTEQIGGGYTRWPALWLQYVDLAVTPEGKENGLGEDRRNVAA